MLGIRKKITVGFVSLAIILFFSGVVSLLELNQLSHSTATLLDKSRQNIETAKALLDAVQNQNTYLLQMVVTNDSSYDSLYLEEVKNFDKTLEKASVTVKDLDALSEIYSARKTYNDIISNNLGNIKQENQQWFMQIYQTSYYNLTSAIKNYMLSSQEGLAGEAQSLEGNAYRAITPGILALGVGIIILLMFLFFINTYIVSPIIAMQKSLKAFISAKVPFDVKMEGKDEIFELKESIEDLVARNKTTRS